MNASDVDIIITNSYRVVWTFRAVEALRRYYPDNRIIVVDDACIECDWQLDFMAERHNVEIVYMQERGGAGRALDAGVRAAGRITEYSAIRCSSSRLTRTRLALCDSFSASASASSK